MTRIIPNCKIIFLSAALLTTNSYFAQLNAAIAQDLKGPITEAEGTTPLPDKDKADGMAGLGAPADATMNQDFLLIGPSKSTPGAAPATPLTAYIGMTLKLEVNRKDIKFEDLKGIEITVVNDTNKPLIIDGDSAAAKIGEREYKCAPLTSLELAVTPSHGLERAPHDLIFDVAPAAASIGAIPTVQDIIKYSQPPITHRYGKDQERRVVEATRFGKRILWPHEKTQGIVYFETKDTISGARIEIPVATLFDKKDAVTLVSTPPAP